MDIVIGTNNIDKLAEYRRMLEPLGFKCLSLKDENIDCDPEETGDTFQENSMIKALEIAKHTNKIVITDDSGLVINSLPDILGVKSKRFLDENSTYDERNTKIIELLEGKDRSAYFFCCITLTNYKGKTVQFDGIINGNIGYQIIGDKGFGYDPIFIPIGYDVTLAQVSEDHKNSISHRGNASRLLVEYLKNN